MSPTPSNETPPDEIEAAKAAICYFAYLDHLDPVRWSRNFWAEADTPPEGWLDSLVTRNPGAPVLISFADVEAEALEWLWPGRIPLGTLTMIDGDPGLGKSLVTVDVAARVSRGLRMPDDTASDLTGPADVIMIFCEDDAAATVRPRLDAAGANVERVHQLQGAAKPDKDGVRPFTLADVETLELALQETGARLVVVDPWAAYIGGRDSKSDEKMRELLTPLAGIAKAHAVAIVIVRHMRKASGSAVTQGAGSMGITGAARSVLVVAADPEDATSRVLAVSKGNLAGATDSLKFSVDSIETSLPDSAGKLKAIAVPFLDWTGVSESSADDLVAAARTDPKDKSAASDVKTWLLETLEAEPVEAKSLERAAEKAKHSIRTYERARAKLRETGKIWVHKDRGACGAFWWGLGAEPSEDWLLQRAGWSTLAAARG